MMWHGEHRPEIILMLADCYRDSNVLKASLVHPESLIEQQTKREQIINALTAEYFNKEQAPDDDSQFQALICMTDLHRQNRNWDAANSAIQQLEQLQPSESVLQQQLVEEMLVLKAHILLESNETETARELLNTLVTKRLESDQEMVLQGHLLLGLTYAADDRLDQALQHLEKPGSIPDSLAYFPANLYLGDVSRRRGLHEKALKHFLTSLNQIKSITQFANPMIDLDEARELVQLAWDEWANSDSFEQFRFAVDLSERMSPLFPEEYSSRLTARVSRQRAELMEAQLRSEKDSTDADRDREILEYWRRAGQAYAQLASRSEASENYEDILWEASQYFRKGNDFENAMRMLEQHLAAGAANKMTTAYLYKAQLLLDLDEPDEEVYLQQAVDILQLVIRDYPKDQLVYDAQILLGKVYLEQGQTEAALQVWRKIINDSPLTPAADEWQRALFLIGRLLFHSTETRPAYLLSALPEQAQAKSQTDIERQERYQRADEAIHWLREFVRRVPDHERILEARWLLAKGLKFRAALPSQQLPDAETENTRLELTAEITDYHLQAQTEFQTLAESLRFLEQQDGLDTVTRQYLRDAYFEPAHIQFELAEYDSTGDGYRTAIELYSSAAFHFTGDPIVLLAYYRIAECYRQLSAKDEARRQLEQARVILNQIPEPFAKESTNYTKEEWQVLLDHSIQLYDLNTN